MFQAKGSSDNYGNQLEIEDEILDTLKILKDT